MWVLIRHKFAASRDDTLVVKRYYQLQTADSIALYMVLERRQFV